jgi:hypothetical protein
MGVVEKYYLSKQAFNRSTISRTHQYYYSYDVIQTIRNFDSFATSSYVHYMECCEFLHGSLIQSQFSHLEDNL